MRECGRPNDRRDVANGTRDVPTGTHGMRLDRSTSVCGRGGGLRRQPRDRQAGVVAALDGGRDLDWPESVSTASADGRRAVRGGPGRCEYVASVGQRVAAVSDRDLPYEFVVVNDGTPNAWALPGGKIGIHRGILVELENEAELAAILGHEVVHAAAKHGAHGFQRQLLFGLAGVGVALAADDSKHARQIVGATNIGFHLAGQKFGRDQERMSDYHGMKYMHWAGYDTSAAVTPAGEVRGSLQRPEQRLVGGTVRQPPAVPRSGGEQPRGPRGVPTGRGGGRKRATGRTWRPCSKTGKPTTSPTEPGRTSTGDSALALRLIDQAIGAQPRESLFHGIRGDILATPGSARRRRAVVRRRDRAESRLLRALPGSRSVTGHLGA